MKSSQGFMRASEARDPRFTYGREPNKQASGTSDIFSLLEKELFLIQIENRESDDERKITNI